MLAWCGAGIMRRFPECGIRMTPLVRKDDAELMFGS